jgi:hypothetical protein
MRGAANELKLKYRQYMHTNEFLPSGQVVVIRNGQEEHMSLVDTKNYRAFHVIRDPRDVAVSCYFSHRYSHPTNEWLSLEAHRQKLNSLPFTEGFLEEMKWAYGVFNYIATWNYNRPNVLEMRFEELIQDEFKFFKKAFDFIGLPLSASELKYLITVWTFESMSDGRSRGKEDQTHHYRKGISGDWKNYFEDVHKEYFKATWGDALIRLGYEKDKNW